MYARSISRLLLRITSYLIAATIGGLAVFVCMEMKIARECNGARYDAWIEEMNPLTVALEAERLQDHKSAQRILEGAVINCETKLHNVYVSDPAFYGQRFFFDSLAHLRHSYRDIPEPSLSRVLSWVPNVSEIRPNFEKTYLNTDRAAPPLNLAQWYSAPVTPEDRVGKVVLLDFWGTWCAPCVKSLPSLQTTYDRFKDQGLVVIAVHSSYSAENVSSFLKDHPYTFAIARDAGTTADSYGVEAWPTRCLIDRSGHVVWSPDPVSPAQIRMTAEEEDRQLADAIQAVLAHTAKQNP